jgi:hypothetical protein
MTGQQFDSRSLRLGWDLPNDVAFSRRVGDTAGQDVARDDDESAFASSPARRDDLVEAMPTRGVPRVQQSSIPDRSRRLRMPFGRFIIETLES